VYTELYITEGGSGELAIKCNDIFKPLNGQDKPIRTVLTKGIAGIGKTISVQKFILDWAEGKANQDIQYPFIFPFRELNLLKTENHSLTDLLNHFSMVIKKSKIQNYNSYKVLFIFDGLDECRLPLDFKNNKICCDVTESSSVDVLLTNLIKGNLLPSALLWITTRPAAANQIPSWCVDQVTEVRGFNDQQKDEYFRKRFIDENLASRIISHIKASRSLHIMCHIPVFCWISAVVLEQMLKHKREEMPKTLTEMYTHLVVFHIKQKNEKYSGKETDPHWNISNVLSLGKLNKMYCFVHLSIQEFLAAVYVILSFVNNNDNLMDKPQSTYSNIEIMFGVKSEVMFYKNAVDKALESEAGHLDLFLRFLLGLSLEANQKHLQGLLKQTRRSSQSHEEIIKYIKKKIRENPSSERCINLFHSLNELKYHSLVQEIQRYLSKGSLSREQLSNAQWSALVFVLLTEEEQLFDLRKYFKSEEGVIQMLPVVKTCRTISSSLLGTLILSMLAGCGITEEGCASLVSALKSNPSSLKQLDLSDNDLIKHFLSEYLCSLSDCLVTEKGCASLVSALKSNPSHLKELDLSKNDLKYSGVKLLATFLEDPQCKLEALRLSGCLVTDKGCAFLASALISNPSHLKELDLSKNELHDSGVHRIADGLQNKQCKLETLRSTVRLSGHRGRLCFSGLSSEVKPLTSERAGSELQSPRRVRSQTALCWTGGSTLETGETQVCSLDVFPIPNECYEVLRLVRIIQVVLCVLKFVCIKVFDDLLCVFY
uniref:NACHT domain-containing protein n=1 Tax=Esox lucius TaxID=8010 RepID=A0AAY5KNA0_ESOLU